MAAAVWALCVVVVEQQTVGAVFRMVCSPSLGDLGQANVDVPLSVDCLPLLEQGRGHITESGEERFLSFLSGEAAVERK